MPALACAHRAHFGTPHTIRGPIGGSTEGSCASARMHPPSPLWHIPRTLRGAIGSSTHTAIHRKP
eukprot:9485478-Pyramimonas_sp.AAC.1